MMDGGKHFTAAALTTTELAFLTEQARIARGDVLTMTTLATCGHPGGSMSSMEMYILLWHCAEVDPAQPRRATRDRIVVSHGHTSPGVYAVLGRRGFFPIADAVAHFRQTGSAFAGHVEQCVPGVEWDTGNLGQGMSAAAGFALAREVQGLRYRVFCLMGDGEQQKGQISETRRIVCKFGLKNFVAFIDLNRLQINGDTAKVMPQHIRENWASDGWRTCDVDGHDFQALYQAVRAALAADEPTVILANTVMSKGVSFMEGDAHWHGAALPDDKCRAALKELGLPDELDTYTALRTQPQQLRMADYHPARPAVALTTGTPRTLGAAEKSDCRSAWGAALADVATANLANPQATPIAVLDCDLKPSVKTGDFAKAAPNRFFQLGIQEHSAATITGAMSSCGVQTFFADFGVFGVDETYNQHRLSILNHAMPKVVCTHCGLDVGEDGKTHQCVDYVGVFRNLLGMEVIVPADPNQTDRATRYIAASDRPALLVMGRSKLPMVLAEDGTPFFGDGYTFRYGAADLVRRGTDAAIVVMGALCGNAIGAAELLKKDGIRAQVLHIATPLALDAAAITAAAATGVIVTVEDHLVRSGLGVSVADALAQQGARCILRMLGVTHYASSGVPAELYKEYKLDAAGIARTVKQALGRA
jgi:transketolase